jgi:malonate decarboxylase gamma subunit
VFAPGAENYWRMGGIQELWSEDDDWSACLATALSHTTNSDERAAIGLERGGRLLAAPTAQIVANS